MRSSVALLVAALVLSAACRSSPPAPPESEDAALLRARVAAQGTEEVVRRFYEKRGFTRAWTDAAARDSLLAALRQASDHGLDPSAYGAAELANTDDDVALTRAFFHYGGDLWHGKDQPGKEGADAALTAKLEEAIEHRDAVTALETLAPQHLGYQQLRDALRRYRAIADGGGWPAIEANAGGAELAARLAAEQDADISAFQRRHGLAASGQLDPDTLRELAVSPADRVRQIEVNLERWRRMPHEFGGHYVLVNLASYLLAAYDGGSRALDMRVIVGRQYTPTPVFVDRITYLVFNPYWNIPDSIARREIRPKGRAFMKRERIEVDARGKLRQQPGPRNPLGRVKFMFPNQFDVYLHDTPSDALFERDARHLSHGCIRVEKPLDLAEFMLAPSGWSREQILAVMESGKTKQVELAAPVPVYILYWTVWEDSDGKVEFRDDAYGYDEGLARSFFVRGGMAERADSR